MKNFLIKSVGTTVKKSRGSVTNPDSSITYTSIDTDIEYWGSFEYIDQRYTFTYSVESSRDTYFEMSDNSYRNGCNYSVTNDKTATEGYGIFKESNIHEVVQSIINECYNIMKKEDNNNG